MSFEFVYLAAAKMDFLDQTNKIQKRLFFKLTIWGSSVIRRKKTNLSQEGDTLCYFSFLVMGRAKLTTFLQHLKLERLHFRID